MTARLFELVADDFELLCEPGLLADVTPEMLSRFEAALWDEGMDRASIRIYLATIRDALAWANGGGLREAA